MSQTMIFIPPIPTAPEEEAKTAPEPEETVWDSVKDLQDAPYVRMEKFSAEYEKAPEFHGNVQADGCPPGRTDVREPACAGGRENGVQAWD